MMYYILFNPFNLVAPSCDNVGIIRDLVCYAALYFYVEGDEFNF